MRQKPITWPTRNQSRSFNDNNNNNNKNFSQETKKKIEHLLQISKSYPLSKKKKIKSKEDDQISNAISNSSNSTSVYQSILQNQFSSSSKKKKKKNRQNPKKRVHFPTFLEIPNTTCVIARPYNMYYSSLCHCAGKRVGEQSRPRHGCLLVRVTESRVTRVDYNWTSIYPFLLAHPEYVHTRTCL